MTVLIDTSFLVEGLFPGTEDERRIWMFFAAVESDSGEMLNVQHPGGIIGGNLILSFWLGLQDYCAGEDLESIKWIKELDSRSDEPLCSLFQPLRASLCDGNWDYEEDEYDVYLRRTPEPKLSAQEFLKTVTEHKDTWVDIHALTRCVNKLIELLQIEPMDNPWQDIKSLLADFEALRHTLTLLAKRNAREVRIKIT